MYALRNTRRFSEIVKPCCNNPKIGLNMKIKSLFRCLGGSYFNFRYLNTTAFNSEKPVYAYSLAKFSQVHSPLFFRESKMHELFESAEKGKYLSAVLTSIDTSELTTVDSYKENYPFTVSGNIIKPIHIIVGCLC